MSAKHTPGPWTILPNTPHFVRAMHPTEGMQPIATVYHFDGELADNARLIAAAPELLAALYSIATDPSAIYSGANANIGDIARAAIAKAKGGAQ